MVFDGCSHIERLYQSILDFIHKALTLIQFIKIAVILIFLYQNDKTEANFLRVENLVSLTFYSIFSQRLALIIVQHYDFL